MFSLLKLFSFKIKIGSIDTHEQFSASAEEAVEEEKKTFLTSLYIEKLFTSMKTENHCKGIRDVIKVSKIVIRELDIKELSIYSYGKICEKMSTSRNKDFNMLYQNKR